MVFPCPKGVSDALGQTGHDEIIQRSEAMQLEPLPLLLNQMLLLSFSLLLMFRKLKRLFLCDDWAQNILHIYIYIYIHAGNNYAQKKRGGWTGV